MQANNEKTMLALNTASTEIQSFVTDAEAEVSAIEEQYSTIVPDAESKDGYAFCKEVRKNVLPIKTGLEDARKMLKRPIIDMGKLIDGSINPLSERLENVYKPFEDAYREVDNRKKRLEEERQEKIQSAFNRMNDSAMEALGQSSTVIESIIDDMSDFDFDPDVFQERTEEACSKHSELMKRLDAMLKAQLAQEDMERRQAEIERKEREQKEAEEAERLRVEREEYAKQAAEKAKEDAEKARLEAEERHKREMIEAEQRAKAQAEAAAIAERERIEKQKADEAEAERLREADKKHKASVHNEILKALVSVGVTDEQGKNIIKLIATGNAGNVRIFY